VSSVLVGVASFPVDVAASPVDIASSPIDVASLVGVASLVTGEPGTSSWPALLLVLGLPGLDPSAPLVPASVPASESTATCGPHATAIANTTSDDIRSTQRA
jgi:hypothetical protein